MYTGIYRFIGKIHATDNGLIERALINYLVNTHRINVCSIRYRKYKFIAERADLEPILGRREINVVHSLLPIIWSCFTCRPSRYNTSKITRVCVYD